MMNGSGSRWRSDKDDADDAAGDLFSETAAEALAEAPNSALLALGGAVLTELRDRGLLHVILCNRADAATAFDVELVRAAEDGLDVVATGYHAATPADYGDWVEESTRLWHRLRRPGISEQDAEALLGTTSDEALLLTLDSARLAESGADADEDGDAACASLMPPPDSAADSVSTRIAIELLRRGVIEAAEEGG